MRHLRVSQIHEIVWTGATLNILRKTDPTSRSSASGTWLWVFFSELTVRRHSPPTKEVASTWPRFFAPGQTFTVYLEHFGQPRRIVRVGALWRPKAVSVSIHGFSRAVGHSSGPGAAVADRQLVEVILRRGRSDDLATKSALSWTYLLRVASRCPPLQV